MVRPAPAPRFLSRRFFAFFALLAMFAQSVVAVLPLAEGRTARMSSHVESNGSPSHFTHDESNCAACQARSIHAVSSTTACPPLPGDHAVVSRPTAAVVVPSADHSPQTNPRAPPTLI
jgi:hypothetical protein